jgi:hypothetical protein
MTKRKLLFAWSIVAAALLGGLAGTCVIKGKSTVLVVLLLIGMAAVLIAGSLTLSREEQPRTESGVVMTPAEWWLHRIFSGLWTFALVFVALLIWFRDPTTAVTGGSAAAIGGLIAALLKRKRVATSAMQK